MHHLRRYVRNKLTALKYHPSILGVILKNLPVSVGSRNYIVTKNIDVVLRAITDNM